MEELLLIIFLLLGPILDVTGFYNLPVNIVVRTLYLIGIITLMLIRKQNLKLLLFLLIICITQYLFQYIYLDYSIKDNISNILKFIYLPCSILYFKNYNFKKYNKNKILSIILFTYIGIFLLSYITNIGAKAYLETDGKSGFKGLFSSINEFSAILVCLLPIVSSYLNKKKKYLLILVLIISAIICSLLLGTKVLFGGIIFTIIYIIFINREILFIKRSKKYKITVISILTLLLGLTIIIFPKTRTYKNMQVQQSFFKVNNIISYEYLNKVIYNDRLTFLTDNFKYYIESKPINILFGIGFNNNDIKLVEIDIFDILIRYGIINLFIFILILTQIPFNKMKKEEKVSMMLLFIVSLTSGHVLIYPNVCIYIGILLSKSMIECD